MTKIKTKWMQVTPEWASILLDRMLEKINIGKIRVRPISNRKVSQYAADMANGNWRKTHQGIAINVNDDLVDGFNRLTAVVKSGKTVWMMVTTGLPVESVDIFDKGKTRTTAQSLYMSHGYSSKDASMLAACCRYIAEFCCRTSFSMSIAQCLDILKIYEKDILAMIDLMPNVQRVSKSITSVLAFHHHIEPKEVVAFAKPLFTSEGLEPGSMPLHLHNFYGSREIKRWSGADSRRIIKTTAMALYHWHHNQTTDRLRPSESALEWLTGLQEKNVEKVRSIIAPTLAELDRNRS